MRASIISLLRRIPNLEEERKKPLERKVADNLVKTHERNEKLSQKKIDTSFLDEAVSAEAGSSLLGRVFINDLRATLAASEVTRLANIPIAKLDGPIIIDIQHAQWKQGELPLASGSIKWNDASVTVTETASLGNVLILLSESDQKLLNAEIKNDGGDIGISGNAELIAEADYAADITLTPNASASKNVKQSLGMFAKRQPNGEYNIQKSGPLSSIGLM